MNVVAHQSEEHHQTLRRIFVVIDDENSAGTDSPARFVEFHYAFVGMRRSSTGQLHSKFAPLSNSVAVGTDGSAVQFDKRAH